jgi:hypothetical protein
MSKETVTRWVRHEKRMERNDYYLRIAHEALLAWNRLTTYSHFAKNKIAHAYIF